MSTINFQNLTPHTIQVAGVEGNIVFRVEPTGPPARCTASSEVVDVFNGVEVVKSTFGPVENLPAPKEGTVYIVSSIVAQQVPDREDVVAPDTGPTAIREAGQVVAVKRFQRFT